MPLGSLMLKPVGRAVFATPPTVALVSAALMPVLVSAQVSVLSASLAALLA